MQRCCQSCLIGYQVISLLMRPFKNCEIIVNMNHTLPFYLQLCCLMKIKRFPRYFHSYKAYNVLTYLDHAKSWVICMCMLSIVWATKNSSIFFCVWHVLTAWCLCVVKKIKNVEPNNQSFMTYIMWCICPLNPMKTLKLLDIITKKTLIIPNNLKHCTLERDCRIDERFTSIDPFKHYTYIKKLFNEHLEG